jgi:hypothetical protein
MGIETEHWIDTRITRRHIPVHIAFCRYQCENRVSNNCINLFPTENITDMQATVSKLTFVNKTVVITKWAFGQR